MSSRSPLLLLQVAFFFIFYRAESIAHESPRDVIIHLSEHIDENKNDHESILWRAVHYRVVGDNQKAIDDLLSLHKKNILSEELIHELCMNYLILQQFDKALNIIDNLTHQDQPSAATWILRSNAFAGMKQYKESLRDCEKAISKDKTQVNWYLTRAKLQWNLDEQSSLAIGLQEGWQETQSAILEIEWIEAVIDTGKPNEVLERINDHLNNSRLKAGWLIRKARALKYMNAPRKEVHSLLQTAIIELNQRLNSSTQPDLSLMRERALAYLLLGSTDMGILDYQTLLNRGMNSWSLRRIKPLISAIYTP